MICSRGPAGSNALERKAMEVVGGRVAASVEDGGDSSAPPARSRTPRCEPVSVADSPLGGTAQDWHLRTGEQEPARAGYACMLWQETRT